MRLSPRRLVLVVAVAAAVPLAAVTPATAATTYTATIGSTSTGSGSYTAASTNPIKLADTSTGIVLTCTSATAAGAVPALGAGLSGTGILTTTASTFTSCTGAGLTFVLTQNAPWTWTVESANASVVTFLISGIHLHYAAAGCNFNVTGSIDASLSLSSQALSIAPVSGSGHLLTTSSVVGCFGAWANGHGQSIVGNYRLTAKTAAGTVGALKIS